MAENGLSALKELRRAAQQGEAFDLALLDQVIPGMTGLELARKIRAERDISEVTL